MSPPGPHAWIEPGQSLIKSARAASAANTKTSKPLFNITLSRPPQRRRSLGKCASAAGVTSIWNAPALNSTLPLPDPAPRTKGSSCAAILHLMRSTSCLFDGPNNTTHSDLTVEDVVSLDFIFSGLESLESPDLPRA